LEEEMNNRPSLKTSLLTAFLLLTALLGAGSVNAQGVGPQSPQNGSDQVFTYQGRLEDSNGSPITATCDFTFSLWDSLSATTGKIGNDSVVSDVSVVEGYFTAPVGGSEFGYAAFTGAARWLQVAVKCGSDSSYTTLSPRQAVTAAPYALSLRPGAEIHNTATSGGDTTALTLRSDNGAGLTVNAETTGVEAYTQSNFGVYGFSSNGTGIYGYGGAYAAYFVGRVHVIADTVLYLSPHDMVVRQDDLSTIDLQPLDNGGVRVKVDGYGTYYLSIPVSTLGQLFGAQLYVKSLEVCYKSTPGGSMKNSIAATSVMKNNGSDSGFTYYIYDTKL
jgi:hypothetical protein